MAETEAPGPRRTAFSSRAAQYVLVFVAASIIWETLSPSTEFGNVGRYAFAVGSAIPVSILAALAEHGIVKAVNAHRD